MADETLMWEVRCEPGRTEELLTWIREEFLRRVEHGERPASCTVYRSVGQDGDRVVVIVDYRGEAVLGEDLPEPPSGLAARPPHQWVFERLDV